MTLIHKSFKKGLKFHMTGKVCFWTGLCHRFYTNMWKRASSRWVGKKVKFELSVLYFCLYQTSNSEEQKPEEELQISKGQCREIEIGLSTSHIHGSHKSIQPFLFQFLFFEQTRPLIASLFIEQICSRYLLKGSVVCLALEMKPIKKRIS